MKKNLFSVVVMIATLLLASVAALADWEQKVNVTIPFEFSIGRQTLPAGDYVIKPVNANGTLALQDESGKVKALFIGLKAQDKSGQTQARLTFRQYGKKYFLAHIWSGHSTNGYETAVTKQERALANEASQRLAGNSTAPRIVTVNAH